MPVLAPRIGAEAPPLELPAVDGTGTRSLAALRGRPVLVSFLGPSDCLFCRAHVMRAIQHQQDFERIGADVVLVAYNDPDLLMAQMLRDLEIPFTLVVDQTRNTYRRWGLEQASWRNFLAPGFWLGVAKFILTREPSLGATPPGPAQLGGDFVVSRDGRLTLVNRMKSWHDRVAIPKLLDALRAS